MELESIVIRDLLAVRGETRLDVRDLPRGLVAIVGDNGQGKTTLLESVPATLFRKFPSRIDKPLHAYAWSADAALELRFLLEGRGLYRARVNIDGPHRTSDAVLTQIQPDGTEVLLTKKGQVTTYDAAIAELLPSLDVFLTSVFAAQNKAGSFSQLGKSERKALFAELLGLAHFEAMATRARTTVAAVDRRMTALSARRDALAQAVSPSLLQQMADQAQALQVRVGDAEVAKARVAAAVQEAEAALVRWQTDANRYSVAAAALATATAELGLNARTRTGLERQRDDTSAHERALSDIISRHDVAVASFDASIRKNRSVLDRKTEIAHAVAALKTADASIAELREELLTEELELRRREQATTTAVGALADAKTAVVTLGDVRRRMALLTTVPCHGVGEFAGCELLKDAKVAEARVPELSALAEQVDQLSAALDHAKADVDAYQQLTAKTRRAISELETKRRALVPTADLAPALAEAEARITSWEDQKRAAGETRVREVAEAMVRESARVAGIDASLTALDGNDARLQALKADAEATIAATTDAHRRYDAQALALSDLRSQAADVAATLATLAAEQAHLADRRAQAERALDEVRAIDVELARLTRDMAEWTFLAGMMGKDGLPVLEIDAAGPIVAAFTNDLLLRAFGPRFTVDIVTQEAKAKKGRDGTEFKEVFEVKVLDATDVSRPRDLADLSGGEQIIVDEALKNAIALYLNQRLPVKLRTCWRDETTGPLDTTRAPQYVAMLRRFHELGGYSHTFFITHSPDCAQLADSRIRMVGGQPLVEAA